MHTVFLGHFGSGKTEVAIAYALQLAAAGQQPRLLDLDVVTPYFRSREPCRRLAELGVEVIAPDAEFSLADLPIITSQALAVLRDTGRPAVLDIGGDEGAQVLRTLAGYLDQAACQVYVVVNPYRPSTATPAQIVQMVGWLSAAANLAVRGLVNNANLGRETTPAVVQKGGAVVAEAARQLGLPMVFTAAAQAVAADLAATAGEQVLSLPLFMRLPWEVE